MWRVAVVASREFGRAMSYDFSWTLMSPDIVCQVEQFVGHHVYQAVYRTGVCKQTSECHWPTIHVSSAQLLSSNPLLPLKVSPYWLRTLVAVHVMIGFSEFDIDS